MENSLPRIKGHAILAYAYTSSVHALSFFFLRSISVISPHLRLGLSSVLLTSGFPTELLYVFLFPVLSATFPVHLTALRIQSEHCSIMIKFKKLISLQFFSVSSYFLSFTNLPQDSVLKTCGLYPRLNVKYQVLYANKIRGSIAILYILILRS